MSSRCFPLVLATALLVGADMSAAAQTPPPPYRLPFGPNTQDAERPDQITFAGSLYAGAHDSSQFASGGVLDDSLQAGRAYQGATTAATYLRRRPRLSFMASASSAVRYYSSLNRIGTQRHSAGIGGSLVASRRLSLRFAQEVSYSPSYQLVLGQPPAQDGAALSFNPAGVDYAVGRDKQVAYGSNAGATYVWDRSRDLTLGYNLSYTNYFKRADFATQQAAVRYTQRLSPGIALRLGYGIGSIGGAGLRSTMHHDLDVGLLYNRSFAFSPRTTLAFTSGSTVVSVDSQQHFELLGGADLTRLLSRRWSSTLSYRRGLTAIDGVPRPYIADSFTGDLNGFVGSRAKVTLQPRYSRGAEVADATRTFENLTTTARVDVAVTRHWALFTEYFDFQYRFAAAPDLPPVLAAGLNRNGLRWGLALWTPVIR